jgi:hypothetical protein
MAGTSTDNVSNLLDRLNELESRIKEWEVRVKDMELEESRIAFLSEIRKLARNLIVENTRLGRAA